MLSNIVKQKLSVMQKTLHKPHAVITQTKNWVFAAISLFIFNTANANNWYVNDASATGDVFTTAIGNDANPGTTASPFATLQFAIDAAAEGDTIYVDAGSYAGNALISKDLTLRGAKFGIPAGPAAVPVNRGTDETIIVGTITYGFALDNTSVDGFTVNRGSGFRGIDAKGFNCIIINNILTGINDMTVQQAGISTGAAAPLRLHSYTISNNNVTGFRYGIYFDGNLENSSVMSLNYITGSGSAGIIHSASEGHQIRANLIENNFQGIVVTRGNNIIEQNTVRGNTASGVRLAGSAFLSGNVIINNFLENNGVAINLTDPNPGAANNEAHFNSITGNALSIVNSHASNFFATCNWFNSTIPAVIALQISGDVTFNPFLTDGIDSDPGTPGFQPLTTCIVVPVILTDFSAYVKNYDVLLSWQTASEVNSSHFVIERSSDNQQFAAIGRVDAKGFSDVKVNYHFTDDKPAYFDRPTFYRLAMIDRDGSKKYSKIIAIVLKTSGSYVQNVYPNPVKAGTVLHTGFISGTSQTIYASLINTMGQVLLQKEVKVIKGMNQVELAVPGGSGTHFLVIKSIDKTQQVPVFIN